MQSIVRPRGQFGRRFNFGGIPQIDWCNPITNELAFFWVTLAGLQINLATGLTGTYTEAVPSVGPYGQQTKFVTNGINFSVDPLVSSNGVGTGDFSIAALAAPGVTTQTIIGSRAVFTRLVANSTYNQSAGSTLFSVFTTPDGSTYQGATSNAVLDGGYHLLHGQRSGSTYKTYFDGADQTSATGASGTADIRGAGDGNGTFIVGSDASTGGGQPADAVVLCAAWNRALSIPEIESFAADPFAFLIFQPDRMRAVISSVAGALSGVTTYHWNLTVNV